MWVTILGVVGDHPWQLSPGKKFKLEWVHRTMFKHVLEAEKGDPSHFQPNVSGGRVGSGRVGSGRVGSDQKYNHSVAPSCKL